MAFGREVAEAYINVHGDLSPFRRDLDAAEGLLQNFGRKLRGLAGINVLEDSFRFGIRFLQNIDRNAVKLAQMVTLIGTAVGGVLNLTGAIAAISTDLAGLAGIGFLAPGFLTGFAISLGVAIAAFKDMKEVLADLAPAFARLQDTISRRFWEQAAQPIRDMTNNLLPTLERQLGNTAEAIGGLFAELASSFQREASPERVSLMFDRLNSAINISREAIAPFVRAMVNLGEVGSKQFERLAEWVVDLSTRFDDFITRSINNGDMDRWIEEAIEGFKNVGRSIDGAIGIVNALDSAFRAAGGGGLAEFAARLQSASDIMNSERFQNALTDMFIGARAALDGFFSGLGRLGPAIESLGPTFIIAGQSIGATLDTLGAHLARVFMNPQMQQGFQDFVLSIETSMRNLGPAMDPLANSIGGLLTLMGQVLESVTTVGAAILIQWGPVFDEMSGKLATLVGPIRDTLLSVVNELTPLFQSLSDNVLGPVVTIIRDSVLPAVESIVQAVGPTLLVMFETVGAFLRDDLSPAFETFEQRMRAAGDQGPEFGAKVGDAIKIIEDFLNTASSPQDTYAFLNSDAVRQFNDDVNSGLETFWRDVQFNTKTGVDNLNTDVNTGLSNFWNDIRNGAQTGTTELNDAVNQGLEDLWNGFMGGWNEGFATFNADVNRMAGEVWNGFVNGLVAAGGKIGADIIAGFTDWVNDVRSFFGIHSPSTLMMQMGTDIIQGFINGLQQMIGQIGAIAQQIVQGFIQGFTGMVEFLGQIWANISASFGAFIGGFGASWNSFWAGLGPMVLTALGNVGSFIAQVWANIMASAAGFFGGFAAAWNGFWGQVGAFAAQAWNNIVQVVSAGINNARNFLQSALSAIGSAWNTAWQNIGQFVSNAWNQIVQFVTSGIQRAQSIVSSVLSAISSVWTSIWSNVSSFASSVWNNIVSFIQSGISRAQGIVSSVLGAIQGAMSGAWNTMLSIVSSAWNSMVSAVSNGVNQVMSFVGSIPGRIMGVLGGLAGQLVSAGANAIQGFINGMASMIGGVVNAAANIAGQAMAAVANALNLGSPSKVFRQFGEWTGEGFAIGMDNMGNLIARTARTMAEAATDAFSSRSMYEQGRDAATALADGMKDNAQLLSDIVSDMTPNMTARFEALGTVGGITGVPNFAVPTGANNVVFENGAIQVVTPTQDPELVASKVIDEFANLSKF